MRTTSRSVGSTRGGAFFRVSITKSAQKLDEDGKQYTAYCVVVTSSEGRDSLWKRYSDFVELDRELHAECPDAPAELEGRSFFGIGIAVSSLFNYDDVVKQRMADLPIYLDKWMPTDSDARSCPRALATFLHLLGSPQAGRAAARKPAAPESGGASEGGGGDEENADLPLVARHRLQRKQNKIKQLWTLVAETEARATALEASSESAVAAAVAAERRTALLGSARVKSDHARAMQSLRAEYESQLKSQPKGMHSSAVEAAIRRLQERLQMQTGLLRDATAEHAAAFAGEVAGRAADLARAAAESTDLRAALAERDEAAKVLELELSALPGLRHALRASEASAAETSSTLDAHRAAGVETETKLVARIAAADAELEAARRENGATVSAAEAASDAARDTLAASAAELQRAAERAVTELAKTEATHAAALDAARLDLKRATSTARATEVRLEETAAKYARCDAQRRKAVGALSAAEEAHAAAESEATSAVVAHERVAAREAAHRKALADATERRESEKREAAATIRSLRTQCDELRASNAAASKQQALTGRDAAAKLRESIAAAEQAKGAHARLADDTQRMLVAALAESKVLREQAAAAAAELVALRAASTAGLAQLRAQIEALRVEEDSAGDAEGVVVSAAGAALRPTATNAGAAPAPAAAVAATSFASLPRVAGPKAAFPRAAVPVPAPAPTISAGSRKRVTSDQGLGSLMAGLRAASTTATAAGQQPSASSASSSSTSSSGASADASSTMTAAAAKSAKAATAAAAATASATAAATGRLLKSGFAGAGRLFKSATGITAQREQTARYRERLVAFYSKHNPAKVGSVDGLLEKYRGKEESLFNALEQKYGVGSTISPARPVVGSEAEQVAAAEGVAVLEEEAEADGTMSPSSCGRSPAEADGTMSPTRSLYEGIAAQEDLVARFKELTVQQRGRHEAELAASTKALREHHGEVVDEVREREIAARIEAGVLRSQLSNTRRKACLLLCCLGVVAVVILCVILYYSGLGKVIWDDIIDSLDTTKSRRLRRRLSLTAGIQ